MTSPLDIAIALAAAALAAAVATVVVRRRRPRLEPAPQRVLFPFYGTHLAQSALDAALRLCRAEHATLVPAYLAEVPRNLPLDSPLRDAEEALPVLEAVEQRALGCGVPVDSRIERGRTHRHAMLELLDHERYDRIVAAAAAPRGEGLSAEDISWLLEHASGEIVVLRAANGVGARASSMAGAAAPES